MAALLGLVARVPEINGTHKGPVVNLVGWVLLVTMCLAVLTVLASKLIVLRKLMWSDLILICAMFFSLGYTLAINEQVKYGLGKSSRHLSQGDYYGFQKSGYASFILYISSIAFAKFATLALLRSLTPQRSHKRPITAAGIFVILWSVASILASAFQCKLPRAWAYTEGQCFKQTSFWYAVGVVDIITDLVIMALPIMVVSKLQLSTDKKFTVAFAFAFRVFAIGTTIFRLIKLPNGFDRTRDIVFHSWLLTVATELEIFFSIFATCIPHLRPFMDSIEAGYLTGVIGDGERPSGYGSQGAGDSYVMRRLGKSRLRDDNYGPGTKTSAMSYVRGKRHSHSIDLPRHGQANNEKNRRPTIGQAVSTNDVVTTVRGGHDDYLGSGERKRSDSAGSDARSGGSVGSKAMIIKTTKEWSVQYQE